MHKYGATGKVSMLTWLIKEKWPFGGWFWFWYIILLLWTSWYINYTMYHENWTVRHFIIFLFFSLIITNCVKIFLNRLIFLIVPHANVSLQTADIYEHLLWNVNIEYSAMNELHCDCIKIDIVYLVHLIFYSLSDLTTLSKIVGELWTFSPY